jgi:predicted enzyme related to lactoylglutathione lyase
MANPFSYCELHTPDASKAKQFYAQLFDWKWTETPTPAGPYHEIEPGEGFPGGLMTSHDGPPQWVTYLRVDDLDAAVAKARTLGAAVLIARHEVPEAGWFGLLTDPTGARFGLWQPKRK